MGSGWHEWPLMIFTVFGQCVAGGFIVLALALLKGRLNAEQQQHPPLFAFALCQVNSRADAAAAIHHDKDAKHHRQKAGHHLGFC